MTRLSSVLLASLSLSFAACAIDDVDVSSTDQAATGEQGLAGAPEPHVMPQRGDVGNPFGGGGGGTKSPNLTNKAPGPVLVASKTMAIFWGPEWANPAFAGTKITGLERFFQRFGGSTFSNTNTEYTHKDGRYVTSSVTYSGKLFDTNTAPKRPPSTSGLATEICSVLNAQGVAPDPDTVYFAYTSTTAGHVSYCAWHSYGTCNGVTIQTAYMPNIDNLAGCDPKDTTTGHDEPLAALANVTAHELSEAITDPHLDAWQDSSGYENADKCAWKWDGTVPFSTYATVDNGDGTFSTVVTDTEQWKLQMNWSNAAYDAGTTHAGVRGCIQQEAAAWSPTATWL
ncbi:MAG TPA: hypothetical protein VLB44_20730 [Kofleriaceae bacterium]|nr:hypothetical protein [Kofleriaceae bacterium]